MTLRWFIIVAVVVFSSCAPHTTPIIVNKSPTFKKPVQHTVRRGETLYSIAWGVRMDFHTLAKWNGISDPYTIYPGQVIKFSPQSLGESRAVPASSQPRSQPGTNVGQPEETKTVAVAKAANPVTPGLGNNATKKNVAQSRPAHVEIPVNRWNWPSKGSIIAKYNPSSGVNGIRIQGKSGSPVNAAAPGEVVYVGEGLRGYGKLIIVKHSATFLSAYAHNQAILVSEGQKINMGQQIARMGDSDAGQTMLHFEIRKDGKPVDPLIYLKGAPKKS